jgi:hypothetical protein
MTFRFSLFSQCFFKGFYFHAQGDGFARREIVSARIFVSFGLKQRKSLGLGIDHMNGNLFSL